MSEPRSRAEAALDDLRFALQPDAAVVEPSGDMRLDHGRLARKGVPEVILAQGKSAEQTLEAVRRQLAAAGRALVSRADAALIERLATTYPHSSCYTPPNSSVVRLTDAGCPEPIQTGGRVAIVTAGSSDWAAAQEARLVAEEMGCAVEVIADVGVAGLHRLFPPLRAALARGVDVIIVAAGMDGALPSVVAGLVPLPVIGLPTSVGYGLGGNGQGALLSMLQSCAPGLTVVNIDNGVGAGAAAGMIANAVAAARGAGLNGSSEPTNENG